MSNDSAVILLNALLRYGRHLDGCLLSCDDPCTCGLDEVIEKYVAESPSSQLKKQPIPAFDLVKSGGPGC
jgi:hypothetical protein